MASRKLIKDMSGVKRRAQARQNFEKEEMLARESRAKLGRDLVLGEYDRKTGEGRERVISARLYGPALRGERKRKPRKEDVR